jgi:hypothetical protein
MEMLFVGRTCLWLTLGRWASKWQMEIVGPPESANSEMKSAVLPLQKRYSLANILHGETRNNWQAMWLS